MLALAPAVLVWLAGWGLNAWLARPGADAAWLRLLPPLVFGVTLLLVWELLVRGLDVSPVLLPAPSADRGADRGERADAAGGRDADLR